MSAERRELGIDAEERDRWSVFSSSSSSSSTTTTSKISFNEELALRHRIGEKQLLWTYRDLAVEELQVMKRMSRVVSNRHNTSISSSFFTMPDHPRFLCESFRALGREVWARWQKGSFWYKGYITAIIMPRVGGNSIAFNVRFDDGDLEDSLTLPNLRWGSNPSDLYRINDLEGRVLYSDRNNVLKAIGMEGNHERELEEEEEDN